ncbi:hypothetical protein T492DRAFT_1002581 [Pavlovales sp. CCMP2436]|nr:hypothetical protein T492DRAFT_1002581 [Pavlovales sp. CCMP2436]
MLSDCLLPPHTQDTSKAGFSGLLPAASSCCLPALPAISLPALAYRCCLLCLPALAAGWAVCTITVLLAEP